MPVEPFNQFVFFGLFNLMRVQKNVNKHPTGPVFERPQRRLAHELEERRALVGLVRVRPAEGVLIPPGPGTREALASADTGAFPM